MDWTTAGRCGSDCQRRRQGPRTIQSTGYLKTVRFLGDTSAGTHEPARGGAQRNGTRIGVILFPVRPADWFAGREPLPQLRLAYGEQVEPADARRPGEEKRWEDVLQRTHDDGQCCGYDDENREYQHDATS